MRGRSTNGRRDPGACRGVEDRARSSIEAGQPDPRRATAAAATAEGEHDEAGASQPRGKEPGRHRASAVRTWQAARIHVEFSVEGIGAHLRRRLHAPSPTFPGTGTRARRRARGDPRSSCRKPPETTAWLFEQKKPRRATSTFSEARTRHWAPERLHRHAGWGGANGIYIGSRYREPNGS